MSLDYLTIGWRIHRLRKRADITQQILSMPFKRYEDMHIMHHSKHLGTLQFYKALVRQLTDEDYAAIRESCHAAIARYFGTAKA